MPPHPTNRLKPASANFAYYPLLYLFASFASGITLGKFAGFATSLVIFGSIALFVLVLRLTVSSTSRLFSVLDHRFIDWRTPTLFVALLFALGGALAYRIDETSVSVNRIRRIYDSGEIASGEPVVVEGTVTGLPEPAFDGEIIRLSAETLFHMGSERSVSGTVRLFAPVGSDEAEDDYARLMLGVGDRIRVTCKLERRDRYLNPGVARLTDILDQQGLDATATIKSPLLIEKLSEGSYSTPLAWIYRQRRLMLDAFTETFSISTAGIMSASLLGDKYFLDRQTAETFREGGTFHILVISGLHITFLGGLTLLFLRMFTRQRLWQFILASGFLWAYTLAVGADVPVVRASVMFTILLFSQAIHRQGTLLNALGACGLILLFWRPGDLFGASFQLTFVSVLAIVAMAFPMIEKLRSIGSWHPSVSRPFPPGVSPWLKRLCETLYWNPAAWEIEKNANIWTAALLKSPLLPRIAGSNLQRAAAYLFEGILVSVTVQIWLLPFLVIYFHRVSPVSILLNLWVGFFIALESFAAVLSVALSAFSETLAVPAVYVTEFLNYLLLSLPHAFLGGSWASWRVPVYTGWTNILYGLYFIPLLCIAFYLFGWNVFDRSRSTSARQRAAITASAATLAVFAALIIAHPFSTPVPDGRLRIDFLDVGQGDSIFVTFPGGKTMLIDGGGQMSYRDVDNEDVEGSDNFEPDTHRIGEAVVSEFLWQRGYSNIDYVLATHADADHIQGLADVVRNFKVGVALFGHIADDDPDQAGLMAVIREREVPVENLAAGDAFEIDGVHVRVLHPGREPDTDGRSENNDSVVLLLSFGDRSVLLTGDIERTAEEELVDGLAPLRADVVKVPHHGSRTSSTPEFIDAVRAEFAVVSVGKESLFGHPHEEVVARWRAAAASVLKTGDRGTISIVTDGRELKLETFLP